MSTAAAAPDQSSDRAQQMFWGCFIALITTSFAFVGRMFLIGTWGKQFGLDAAEEGRLLGIGIWPFAVSIILFSLFIDKIGYKTAMFFAFLGHMIWTVMAVSAYFVEDKALGFNLLYWGSLIVALGNGTVEAFINPVVATMFNREKTKWLNILHAGWPAGLVAMGLIFIGIDTVYGKNDAGDWLAPWWIKVGLIGIPSIVYLVMLIGLKFPESERVSSGVTYKEMLQEFGIGGALIVGILLVLQLMDFFAVADAAGQRVTPTNLKYLFIGIGVVFVAGFGAYTQTIGRPILLFLALIMVPLATTEIGTDGWITAIMEGIAEDNNFHSGWILVYTSAIMLVLRFFAGPIVHAVSPLGLLAVSAVLAIAGLTYLSTAAGAAIFVAATLYGFGKTFFWPTMLGVVSEQCPKGGALTLNAVGGIGMLAVGTLGFPYIGTLQPKAERAAIVANEELQKKVPGLVADDKVVPVVERKIYEVIPYTEIKEDELKALVDKLPESERADVATEIKEIREKSKQGALYDMAIFPCIMLVCYIGLFVYFQSRGGYKAEVLTGHAADDEQYTGGVEGPADR